ncbi:VanW family protein [Candidatus Gottesmanbacteria bacterium]|nr:VanW family protein [Candidatus Gottesmanbacteria bacterium]
MAVVKKTPKNKKILSKRGIFKISLGISFFCLALIIFAITYFENKYLNKIYPGVTIDNISFAGKTPIDIENYFLSKNTPFNDLNITLQFEDKIATLSGSALEIFYDGKLSAIQAYSIGRTGNIFSDTYYKWIAITQGINLTSVISYKSSLIEETVNNISLSIDIPPQDALFNFENGKVTAFKTSKSGRLINKKQAQDMITAYINNLAKDDNGLSNKITLNLPVEDVKPKITTESSNSYGIRELLAEGKSKFTGSIKGRIYNVALAASRINGRLVGPGEVLSFNDALGDVSASTGFQPAYIIKGGRTVLGDGGGVCQVSTTLFRAALNAGLPIIERFSHSYRVGYYEQDSPPGLDATVYSPSYDLKIKNDTPHHILIQAETDTQNLTLEFRLFGTKDGRQVEISKPVIYSQTPPPSDLYQDDPTIPTGIIRQADWKAWGAKVNFDYKVTKNGEVVNKQSFFSNYQPWQAVFLKGTK